jgi:hypothetical protein
MTKEQIALAKRAVACKGWRWLGGMRTANEERVIGVMRDDVLHLCAPLDAALESVSITRVFFDSSGSCLPDLTDPATLGCLLALVREAWWGDEWISCAYARKERSWVVTSCHISALLVSGKHIHGATEAEALVAALEAAP